MAAATDNRHLDAVAKGLRSLHRTLAERARRDAETERQTVIMPGEWLMRRSCWETRSAATSRNFRFDD